MGKLTFVDGGLRRIALACLRTGQNCLQLEPVRTVRTSRLSIRRGAGLSPRNKLTLAGQGEEARERRCRHDEVNVTRMWCTVKRMPW